MFFGLTAALMCGVYTCKHKSKIFWMKYVTGMFTVAFLIEAFYLHKKYQYSFMIMTWVLLIFLYYEKWRDRK